MRRRFWVRFNICFQYNMRGKQGGLSLPDTLTMRNESGVFMYNSRKMRGMQRRYALADIVKDEDG